MSRRILVAILAVASIVAFTLSSPTMLRAQCMTCPGDMTGDGNLNSRDIQAFTSCLVNASPPTGPCSCGDMNADNLLNIAADLPAFVTVLLSSSGPCATGQTLTLNLSDPLVGITRTINGTVCLSTPAGPGGVTVTLGSMNAGIATIAPAMLTIPEGSTCAPVGVTGVGFGSTTVTANAPGLTQATAPITVTSQIISIGFGLQLIPGQTAGLPLSLSVPAPPGGVTVTLGTSNAGVATVTPSVFIPAGQQLPAANPQVTGVSIGTANITASTPNFAPDTRQVVVASNVILLNPTTLNVAQSQSRTMTIQLERSAPAGGQSINLSIDNPGVATVQATAVVSAGENSIDVPVNGMSIGTTTLRASHAPSGIPEARATINVGPAGINLTGGSIGRDLMVSASGTLTAAAPAGNLLITITSTDANSLRLSNDPTVLGTASINVTVPAGSISLPTYYVHSLASGGMAGISATAANYNPGSATYSFVPSGFVIWSPSVINTVTNLPPTSIQLRPGRLDPVTLGLVTYQNLRGGITASVPVVSSNPAVGSITVSPVVFDHGEFFDNTGFTPLTAGSSTISISQPAGFTTPSGLQSITANVSSQGIVLSNMSIGDDLQLAATLTLTSPAPAGNLPVTITSANPAKVKLSNNATAAGGASTMVTVAAGSTTSPSFYVQGFDTSGTVDITATAAGFGPGTATITLQPSGFIIWSPTVINTVTGQPATTVQLRPVRLDPLTLAYSSNQNIRGGLTVNVPVLSSAPAVGTMTVTPVVFTGNEFFDNTGFMPTGAGTSTISLVTPGGFETPSNFQSIQANVSAQGIILSNAAIGDDLQISTNLTITTAAPAGNLNVTLTSADPSKLLLSNSPTLVGSSGIVVTVPAGSTTSPSFYVQSLANTGMVDYTATAPGYGPGTATVTLQPSGFIIWSPNSFTTTTFSPNTTVQIRPVRLNPATLVYDANQNIRGGLTVNVPISTSDVNVGVMTVSPLVFNGNDFFLNTAFHPLVAGVTNINLGTPAGFETPSSFQSIVATVRAPTINMSNTDVGEDLQVGQSITLEATPPNPVNVTVTVNDPSIATLSIDPVAAGTNSITFTGVTTTNVGTVQVQGRMQGMSTSITIQAAGYSDRLASANVRPSGFIIWTPASINTTTFSTPTTVQIRPVRLNPVTLNYDANQNIRGGLASINVGVTSSNNTVGTITASPLAFTANEFFKNTTFAPQNAGNSTIAVVTPAGFDTPSDFQSIPATVSAPNINLGNVNVGEDLQLATTVTLAATPPSPVTVTVSVANSAVATLSTDPLLAGSGTIVFPGVTSTNVGTINVQGRTQGMTTALTATATGYNTSNNTVTVNPSGFIIWAPASISTTTYSVPTTVQIRPVRLNPTTLNYDANQNIRGGLNNVGVTVFSSNNGIGTMTVSPVVFNANSFFVNTAFSPQAVGDCTIGLATPAGFDTPSDIQMIPASVALPTILLGGNMSVGKDLQVSTTVGLQAAPPGPVDVTITSASPADFVISRDPLLLGSASTTFTGVTTTIVGTLYVQGLTRNPNRQLSATAAGYANSSVVVNVDPSGFIVWSPTSISTTVAAPATTVQIRPVRLDPVTFNYAGNQNLRGGLSGVMVGVSTSNAAVGNMTISPLTFNTNEFFKNTAFQPAGVGSCTINVATPAGFDTPSNLVSINAGVTP